MRRYWKWFAGFAICTAVVSTAYAAATIYQYKDITGSTFPILIWGTCGTTNQFCTNMVLSDSNGNELSSALTGAIPTGNNVIGFTSTDPCASGSKTNIPISTNSTSSAQLVGLSGTTTIYVCSLSLIASGATTVAITTGTGTACATSNAAVIGTTTVNIANSMALAANGGLTLGSGSGTVAKSAAASELCIVLGAANFVNGNLTYVQK